MDKQKHSIPLRQVIDNGEYCQTLPIYVCPKDIYDSGGDGGTFSESSAARLMFREAGFDRE